MANNRTYIDKISISLFYLWLLSLAFYKFSIIKTFSVDNLLAPVLIFLWFLTTPVHDPDVRITRIKEISLIILLFGIFVCGNIISLINTKEIIWEKLYQLSKISIFFILPVLYIKDLAVFRKTNSILIVLALIGCISTILVSVGMLQLPYERFSPSRIGIEEIPKSIGLFSAYGDMALLSSYTILLTVSLSKDSYLFGLGSRKIKSLVIFILLLGLLGSQSRNIALTMMAGMVFYLLLRIIYKRSSRLRAFAPGLLFLPAVFVVLLLFMYGEDLIKLLSQWGGKQASGTASARVDQYKFALELFRESPFVFLIGVSGKTYEIYTNNIDSIHNLWLKVVLQGGITSLIPIALLLLKAFRKAIKNSTQNSIPEKYVVSAFIISMFVSSQFNIAGTSVFWVMLSVSLSISWIGLKKEP